ncbi:uncharacterized protein si:dkey-192g7.3 [Engraulis encrasicolus]|uniref:uncharacterized protein si:dkey-192g7.3 n=1 Tax=Engraulis encrasicolus TaxID=184585 RepID=UPI002FD4BF51
MKTLTGIWLWIILLMAYCYRECSSTSIPPTNITASEYEDVLLRCDCEDKEKVVWQTSTKSTNTHDEYVYYNKSDPHSQQASHFFDNRVNFFLGEERGNCSLQLLNVTAADEGVYDCYGLPRPFIIRKVILTVTVVPVVVNNPQVDPSSPPTTSSDQTISIAVGLSVILALIAVFSMLLVFRCHRQRQRRQREPASTEEEMQLR